MAQSKRHHYLPQFFIKGFVGEDGKVAVYNIEKKKLEPVRKSPAQVLFEWNRNTFRVNGETTDFVETLFQFGETRFAPLYRKIIEQTGQINLGLGDLMQLIIFIGGIYWRVPDRDKEMHEFMQTATKEDLLFTIRNKETGQEAPKEVFERIMKEPAFIESSKIVKAIHDYLRVDFETRLANWKLYYSSTNVQLHLISDNPVILRSKTKQNILNTELIFPFSKGKTVYHTNGKRLNELPPEHRVAVDLLIFMQARKMVCGPNGEYLNHIAQLASLYKNEKHIEHLKEQVFQVFR